MSSFTKDEFDSLLATKNVDEIKSALTRLNEEIPAVQEMHDRAVADGDKTGDYRLSSGILKGTVGGMEEHGFSANVGLITLRNTRKKLYENLKKINSSRPRYAKEHSGAPTAEEAELEQDAIEESLDSIVGPELAELIEDDKRQTEHEESPDEEIHDFVKNSRITELFNELTKLETRKSEIQNKILMLHMGISV